jgi:hypothetical protein
MELISTGTMVALVKDEKSKTEIENIKLRR